MFFNSGNIGKPTLGKFNGGRPRRKWNQKVLSAVAEQLIWVLSTPLHVPNQKNTGTEP